MLILEKLEEFLFPSVFYVTNSNKSFFSGPGPELSSCCPHLHGRHPIFRAERPGVARSGGENIQTFTTTSLP